MIKNFPFLIICLLAFGCSQGVQMENNTTQHVSKPDTPIQISKEKNSGIKLSWADSLIINYINKTNNELIQATKKDGIDVEWNLQNNQKNNTANFYVYQIGHTFEHKFITDQCLYIDSLSRKIYEYDVANDKLELWKK